MMSLHPPCYASLSDRLYRSVRMIPLVTLLALLVLLHCAANSWGTTPMDHTRLVEYENSPLGNRIALILVHGVHGNEWDNGVNPAPLPV
jgi:hypothetical protein